MKRCTSCGESKPLDAFPVHHSTRDRRDSHCRACRRAGNWTRNLRAHYGLSVDDYRRMLDAQGGVCAICGRAETAHSPLGTPYALAVDHDAVTGRVRGLLCVNCNRGIGFLGHSPALLRAAIAYLA